MPVGVLGRADALSSEDGDLQLCHELRAEVGVAQQLWSVTPVAGLLAQKRLSYCPEPMAVDHAAKELARSALVVVWKRPLRPAMSVLIFR